VLGFSVIFSLVGILLQTVLAHASASVEVWLGRIGGVIIIFFGLFLLKLIQPGFLTRDHTIAVKRKFSSVYLTSFVFGAAFAVGWTPCVSAALGAILALASVHAGSAFVLLISYTLGVGIPFLLVGLFTNQAQALIDKAGKWLTYLEYFFGILLIVIGVLIFTSELSQIGNVQFLSNALTNLNIGTSAGGNISSFSFFNAGIAFFAGLCSFFSPCILPIIPGFLSYLASTAINKNHTV
jgi:cytochrome c-type biogenesis protein